MQPISLWGGAGDVGQKCLSAPCKHSPLHTNVPLFNFFFFPTPSFKQPVIQGKKKKKKKKRLQELLNREFGEGVK